MSSCGELNPVLRFPKPAVVRPRTRCIHKLGRNGESRTHEFPAPKAGGSPLAYVPKLTENLNSCLEGTTGGELLDKTPWRLQARGVAG